MNKAITEAMVEAAYNVLVNRNMLHIGTETTRAALSAALSAGQAQPVAIKPMEWKDEGGGEHIAQSVIGWFHIGRPASFWNLTTPFGEVVSFETLEAAKAAAQRDFETRIRSALVPPAVQGEVHAQLALIKHLAEYTTEKNWADKRLYIMQAVDRALSPPSTAVAVGETEGWRPIETAPIDGTDILVCVTYNLSDDEWETMQWVDWQVPAIVWPVFRDRIDIPFPPTHWRHLPSAPSATLTDAGKPE